MGGPGPLLSTSSAACLHGDEAAGCVLPPTWGWEKVVQAAGVGGAVAKPYSLPLQMCWGDLQPMCFSVWGDPEAFLAPVDTAPVVGLASQRSPALVMSILMRPWSSHLCQEPTVVTLPKPRLLLLGSCDRSSQRSLGKALPTPSTPRHHSDHDGGHVGW